MYAKWDAQSFPLAILASKKNKLLFLLTFINIYVKQSTSPSSLKIVSAFLGSKVFKIMSVRLDSTIVRTSLMLAPGNYNFACD
jgi:hypothetical protein